jgi:3',5'-cyclic AMP phosphodiesterase CpdA
MVKKQKTAGSGIFGRFFRSIISIIVLSALVLGIAFFTKELATTTPSKFAKQSARILALLHLRVDESQVNQVGEVAGKFVERISQTNLGSGVSNTRQSSDSLAIGTDPNIKPAETPLLKIAIMADIHDDTANLTKALTQAKNDNVDAVFVLGDMTNYGDVSSLSEIKDILTASGLTYYVLPGDHDLAQTVGPQNFKTVFGNNYQVVALKGIDFLMLDDSANFTKIDNTEVLWLENNLPNADFVLLPQPLYTQELDTPFKDMFMGSTKDPQTDPVLKAKQDAVRTQGEFVLKLIEGAPKVEAVIAGDHHISSQKADPERSSLQHYVVGAITDTIELWEKEMPQKVLQSPRFSELIVMQDGGFNVRDVVLE